MSIIAIVGSGETAVKYQGEEDISFAMNGAMGLKQPFTYFCSFDPRVTNKPYWNKRPDVIRMLGLNIATMDKIMYPGYLMVKRRFIVGETVTKDKCKDIPEPEKPHKYWEFEKLTSLKDVDINSKYLHAAQNIVVPTFQLACRMKPTEIHLYGIGLDTHQYFEGHAEKSHDKPFGSLPARTMAILIQQAKDSGIIIKATKENRSRIIGAEWI